MRMPTSASHRPYVGSALNWQGHPHAQLQVPVSSATILHEVFGIALLYTPFAARNTSSAPAPIEIIPTKTANASPYVQCFSTKMTPATASISGTLITPSASCIAINPQQQAAQYAP